MRYSSDWVNDSIWSQYERAKPMYTDREDDRRHDPTKPSGSTSKTWDPRADSKFWHEKSTDELVKYVFDAMATKA